MNYRQWLVMTLGSILLILLAIAGFNAWMDPLWTFDHAHRGNSIQVSFNERQQKTNHLTFTNTRYKALLLGSSRVTYLDQHQLIPGPVYNYAVNNMLPYEYPDYIDYAVRCSGQEFEVIYIGLDFFATNRNLVLPNRFEAPAYYINEANRFGYRWWNLLSFDALQYSRQNLGMARSGVPVNFAYTRSNVKTLQPTTPQEKEQRIADNLQWYGQQAYTTDYQYQNVALILQQIKDKYPRTRLVVFTTPVAEPLFREMVRVGRLPDYQRWINDNTRVCGELYNFMTINSVTSDLDNFYDASHIYPAVGRWVAHRVSGIEDQSIPDDFGIRVTPANLDEHLRAVEAQASR